jgi:DNA-binding FadR family transcriptional regulator
VPIRAIEPRRLYRQVADHLRELIDNGDFPAGGRLPTERELAERLGISRPTVREALIALEVEGRVRIRVGSGIYVTEAPAAPVAALHTLQPVEGPIELLRAREFVEGAVAAEAATLVRPADVEAMDDVIARMAAGGHPSQETVALDREFHTTVAAILGNAVLVRFVGELFDQRVNPYFGRLASYFENEETWRVAIEEHRAVRDAIVARDPERAREAMRHHLQQSQRRFSREFGEDDGAPADHGPGAVPP